MRHSCACAAACAVVGRDLRFGALVVARREFSRPRATLSVFSWPSAYFNAPTATLMVFSWSGDALAMARHGLRRATASLSVFSVSWTSLSCPGASIGCVAPEAARWWDAASSDSALWNPLGVFSWRCYGAARISTRERRPSRCCFRGLVTLLLGALESWSREMRDSQ